MSWEKITLGSIADIFSGYAFKCADMNAEYGTPLLKIKNISNLRVSTECDSFLNVDFDLSKYSRFLLREDDFLVAMTGQGSVGRIGKMFNYKTGYYVNQRVAIVRVDAIKANPTFIFFQIATQENENELFKKANGAGQPNISAKQIGELELVLPDIDTQNKIADILSAYDDLIENNQKQIKLLEEAAQRLYKEWFVDLRFPEYENTPIIDGIPKGWSVAILDDIAYESGKNEKKERRDNYNYYLPIDCLPKQSLGYTETADISLAESSLVSFAKDDIIFGAMRPYFHKVVIARDSGLTRSTCFVLNSRQNEFWSYLAMLMFSKNTVDYATQISVGTTMPYARWKDLKQMPVIIPSKAITENFQCVIKPIIEKIGYLSKLIINLKQARNILLPKLMSGELEV